MKPPQSTIKPTLLSIPYLTDSLEYFRVIEASLPHALILQSDNSEHLTSDNIYGRFDILTAAPEYGIQTENNGVQWVGNTKLAIPSIKNLTSFNALRVLINHIQQEDFDISGCQQTDLPFYGGIIGYCSYDLAREEFSLQANPDADINLPDMQFNFYSWACVQDHEKKCAWLVFHPACTNSTRQTLSALIQHTTTKISTEKKTENYAEINNDIVFEMQKKSYLSKFERIKNYIINGDCYQINFSQRFTTKTNKDAVTLYRDMRRATPSPFSAIIPVLGKEAHIISLSPERFLQIDSNKTVTTQPIKGTSKRFSDLDEDTASAQSLLSSEKCQAENLMIVDLLRNDLGKCCETGSVHVKKLFELQSFPNVHHLVSTIKGKLKPELNGADLLRACFPGGSITGAPKKRAMEIINELEPVRRSIYCGSIAIFSAHGTMDSSIMIRTALLQQGKVYCWAGGGIVSDSDCESEYEESITKVKALLDAVHAP